MGFFVCMKTDFDISEALSLASEGRVEEAVAMLGDMAASCPDRDDIFFCRGKLLWKLGRRAEATSDYIRAVAINPESPAARALEMARDVESFFNPDIFNP